VLFMMTLVTGFLYFFATGNETRGSQGFLMLSMAMHNLLLATYHHPYLAGNMAPGYLLTYYMVTIATYYVFLSAWLTSTMLISVTLGIQYMMLRWWFDPTDTDQVYAPILLFGMIAVSHYTRVSQASLHRLTWLGSERARHLQRRAEEIEVFRSHLLKLVGHDLRQPLGALRYYSAALRIGAANLGGDEDNSSRRVADQVNRALDQITEMLDRALELAQLDNDSVVARCRKQSIAPLARQLREHFSSAAAIAGVEIRIHGGSRVLSHDPALMMPVLRNLVANALQHHDHNTSWPRVVVAFRGENGDRIDVIDNGGGLSTQILQNLMQVNRGQEADTRRGVGLTIARHFAQKQGWQIEVASYPGRGTCWHLHLPSEPVLPEPARFIADQEPRP
jgi:signal transduction histidine kinase